MASTPSRSIRSRFAPTRRASTASRPASSSSHGICTTHVGARGDQRRQGVPGAGRPADALQRLEHRHVRLRRAVLHHALAPPDQGRAVGEPVQEGVDQGRLPGAGLAGHEHDAGRAVRGGGELDPQGGELGVAPDGRRARRGRGPGAAAAAAGASRDGSWRSTARSSSRSRADGSMPSSSLSARNASW